ncbi:MAG: hypothetical protein AAF415_20030 [Pseudomonadota bacterium]
MTAMQGLYLSDTQVADLTPLTDLEALRDLEFSDIPAWTPIQGWRSSAIS